MNKTIKKKIIKALNTLKGILKQKFYYLNNAKKNTVISIIRCIFHAYNNVHLQN